MKATIIYPTAEKIIEYNLLVITLIPAKKSDQVKVLSRQKLENIIRECRELNGDLYDKAVFLLSNLIRQHPFASGNRRTALVTTKEFLLQNHEKFKIEDNPNHARVLLGIRERFYRDEEVKGWIKYGRIREFSRFK
ncbi:Fic family protein [Candidatus Woesearchaeota archaeon]|nr:Fic family protein [Candidatus Woesearchaeota archaeon]